MRSLNLLVLFYCLVYTVKGESYCTCAAAAACTIATNQDITNPQPLLLRPEGGIGNNAFFLPKFDDVIPIHEGQVIGLSCLGGNLRIDGTSMGSNFIDATCTADGRFTVLNQTVPFSLITCTRYPVHVARFSGNTCLTRHREIEVGFQIEGNFIKLMTACFDGSIQTTVYTKYELTPVISGRQVNFPRPAWIEDDFYNLGQNSLNTLYTRNTQRITINGLLGLEANSTKYVHQTNNFFLARGHLVPMVSYVFGSQQRATFYFINAAPQWQVFNGANWMVLEINYRNFVIRNGLNVSVYTGTHGVSTLPHAVTGDDIELFLFVDGNHNRAIPVPALFWKVLYEPTTKAGVVFIGVNNPYIEDPSRYIICPDVCASIDWLTWSPTIITRGYTYCCTVEDFRRVVNGLPGFEVTQLLR